MMRNKLILRIAWGSVALLTLVVIVMGSMIYNKIYTTNVSIEDSGAKYLNIPTGSGLEDVILILKENKLLISEKSFRWTALQMKYDLSIKPGRYLLKAKMNNKELVTLLRSGQQAPVRLTFNNIRSTEQLANKVGEQIEAKPEDILKLLDDESYVSKLGFSKSNVFAMFIPNTYEFYWNTSADRFLTRMKKEYDRFWNTHRLNQAKEIGLTPIEVSVIASIVQLESNKEDEKPIIAGVYMNRYNRNWKLEADPTLVYALGDYSVKRILNAYKEIDSPYNTYRYKGLPPGPICLPSPASISSVLNYIPHKFMYFCAKDDFSGYHEFSTTYSQHLRNAKRFQRALDKRGIRS